MPESIAWPLEEQDRHIVELYELLTKYAPEEASPDRAADAVHEIIARVMAKLRAGTWARPEPMDEAFARKLLANRVASEYRSERRGAARDHEHLRARELRHPEWMAADELQGEEWILQCQNEALAKVTARCREAFHLVDGEGCSHAEAGIRLRRSPNTICNLVCKARRALREYAETKGISAEMIGGGARRKHSSSKREYPRFAPAYKAAEAVAVTR